MGRVNRIKIFFLNKISKKFTNKSFERNLSGFRLFKIGTLRERYFKVNNALFHWYLSRALLIGHSLNIWDHSPSWQEYQLSVFPPLIRKLSAFLQDNNYKLTYNCLILGKDNSILFAIKNNRQKMFLPKLRNISA